MGNVRAVLSTKDIDAVGMYNEFVRTELCETIHLHYRDLRLNLTGEQFLNVKKTLQDGYQRWVDLGKPYPGNKDDLLCVLKMEDEQIFKNEMKIELVEGGYVHIHYKDMRLEVQFYTFFLFVTLFKEACLTLERIVVGIPVDLIDPYDHCHFEDKEKWFNDDYAVHERGIEYMMMRIKKGDEIVPIEVTPRPDGTFWRRDGYKRYMSYKRLGKKTIPCYVVSEETAYTMPQNGAATFKGDVHATA